MRERNLFATLIYAKLSRDNALRLAASCPQKNRQQKMNRMNGRRRFENLKPPLHVADHVVAPVDDVPVSVAYFVWAFVSL